MLTLLEISSGNQLYWAKTTALSDQTCGGHKGQVTLTSLTFRSHLGSLAHGPLPHLQRVSLNCSFHQIFSSCLRPSSLPLIRILDYIKPTRMTPKSLPTSRSLTYLLVPFNGRSNIFTFLRIRMWSVIYPTSLPSVSAHSRV